MNYLSRTSYLNTILFLVALLAMHVLSKKPAKVNENVQYMLKKAALYSQIAYCNSTKIKEGNSELSFDNVQEKEAYRNFHNSSTGISGYSTVNKEYKNIIISFAGTFNFENVLADILALRKPISLKGAEDIQVHAGFYFSTRSVIRQVGKSLTKLIKKYPDYKVLFVGHSLGGAIAVIAAAFMVNRGVIPDKGANSAIITFGQPRVGNKEFAEYINGLKFRYYRVTRALDPIPMLPPILMRYLHSNAEYFVNRNDKAFDCKTSDGSEDPECNASQKFKLRIIPHVKYFEDPKKCVNLEIN